MWDLFTKVRKVIDTFSSWLAAFANNASGAFNIVKAGRAFTGMQPQSPAEIAVGCVAGAVSIIPTIMQANSYTQMMADLHGDKASCKCCGDNRICKSTASEIYSAIVKTAQSGASLSVVLLSTPLGLAGALSVTAGFSLMYLLAQYYVAKVGTLQPDAEIVDEAEESNEIWNGIKKAIAAGGGVLGVATSLLGITTIIEWIKAKDLNIVVDHHNKDVELIDGLVLLAAIIPMVLQGKAYWKNADKVLSGPRDSTYDFLGLHQVSNCKKWTLFAANLYSALFKAIGSTTGPISLANLLFDKALKLGPWPSVGIGVGMVGFITYQQVAYINRDDAPTTSANKREYLPLLRPTN